MIELKHISRSFGDIAAVKDVSFEIRAGRITIVAGADGAGKSTLFKIMVGLVRKDSGAVFLKGEDIGDDYRKMTAVTGYMPERFSLYPDLSVEENLNFFSDIYRVPVKEREERKQRLLETTGMLPFKNRRAGALSGGMKQKLSLSCILLSAPEFIILDEPTTGVDPLSRIEFFNIIKELKTEGKTIVMSTPYLDEAEQGDDIVFLKDGRVIKKDSIERLKQNFPARLFRILPRGNIFDIMKDLENRKELRANLYLRGKYIKYLRTGQQDHIDWIPHLKVEEEKPGLEDMYIYYERMAAGDMDME
jgi:ABC-2 type transport system ATP-binding protein